MYSSSCPSKDFKSKCSTALKQRQKRPLELHRINSIFPRFSKTESKGSNKLIRGFFNGELISFTWNSFNNLLPQNSSQNPASPKPCHVCQVWMAWCRNWCSIHIRNRAGTSAVGNLRWCQGSFAPFWGTESQQSCVFTLGVWSPGLPQAADGAATVHWW